jgi:hypothetical protein
MRSSAAGWAASAPGFLLTTLLCACSSEYMPPPSSPRVAVVMDGGRLTYVRSGQRHAHGVAGGGLIEATEGVPAAERAAATYHSRLTTGLVLTTVGAAIMLLTPVILLSPGDRSADARLGAAMIGLGAGLSVTVAGGVVTLTGMPYQWDAINLYNAEIDRRAPNYSDTPIPSGTPLGPPPPLPGLPPGSRPPARPAPPAPPAPSEPYEPPGPTPAPTPSLTSPPPPPWMPPPPGGPATPLGWWRACPRGHPCARQARRFPAAAP